jgi:hypothetical protein
MDIKNIFTGPNNIHEDNSVEQTHLPGTINATAKTTTATTKWDMTDSLLTISVELSTIQVATSCAVTQ